MFSATRPLHSVERQYKTSNMPCNARST